MKYWTCASVALFIGTACSASASTVDFQYVESLEYTLEYFRPQGGGRVEFIEYPQGSWTAYVTPPPTGEVTYELSHEYIYFQIIQPGISGLGSPSDLAGMTIDFDTWTSKPLPGFRSPVDFVAWQDGWWYDGTTSPRGDPEDDGIPRMGGSITFDNSGAVSDHNIEFCWGWCNDRFVSRSTSKDFSNDVAFQNLINPEVMEGLTVFDSSYWYAANASHSLHSGFWQLSRVEKNCWLEDAAGGMVEIAECQTETPSPVPLPASWGFLLIALGALAGLRARRTAQRA